MQWKIDYFKDDKRTAFTFPSENLSSAIEYWEKHTKLNPNIHIFKISNITVMMTCMLAVRKLRGFNPSR